MFADLLIPSKDSLDLGMVGCGFIAVLRLASAASQPLARAAIEFRKGVEEK